MESWSFPCTDFANAVVCWLEARGWITAGGLQQIPVDEWEAGRRLVQFRRSQNGSLITATFEAVTLEDRIPNSICVSCIWWAEKKEYYVTSVDTISLLESLVHPP